MDSASIIALIGLGLAILTALVKLVMDIGKMRGIVTTKLTAIEAALSDGRSVMSALDSRINDHETRIRIIETKIDGAIE